MMSSSFVSASGDIVSSNRRIPRLHIRRLVLVSIIIFTCILTNPCNYLFIKNIHLNKLSSWRAKRMNSKSDSRMRTKPKQNSWITSSSSSSSLWNELWKKIKRQFSCPQEIKYTNYILFSLRRKMSVLELVLFSKNIPLCNWNSRDAYSNGCRSLGTFYLYHHGIFCLFVCYRRIVVLLKKNLFPTSTPLSTTYTHPLCM